ncbi:hypothetical protein [Streptomyces palmae]|uniref:hypothetical protein n=1 Tax=Streptomyces palmae TaxID=1701085 RepID=UPI001AE06CC4|nr:hypothetical protein [Streptomyces palmae]
MGQPKDDAGSTPPTFGSSLVKEAETLSKFKGRIDTVLTALQESAASKKNISHQTIPQHAYGKDFAAAKSMAEHYDKVRLRLEELSQFLGDRIEAMGIAAKIAERGYDSIDDDLAARLRELEKRAREHYRKPEDEGNSHGQDSPERGKGSGNNSGGSQL